MHWSIPGGPRSVVVRTSSNRTGSPDKDVELRTMDSPRRLSPNRVRRLGEKRRKIVVPCLSKAYAVQRAVGLESQRMTPAIEPELVVEYHLRCFCGESIVATEKTVTCEKCGRALKIRRVRRHRQPENLIPRCSTATKGWRWRKNIVESVVERRFHLQCACGASIITTEKKAICSACGGTTELHRVVKRGPSHAIVEYDFDCCFCGSSIGTTEKTVTCAQCGNTLRIVRVGTHGVYRKAVPYLSDQDEILES